MSGFLISCATCRAISPHASTRCARAISVTSSSVTTDRRRRRAESRQRAAQLLLVRRQLELLLVLRRLEKTLDDLAEMRSGARAPNGAPVASGRRAASRRADSRATTRPSGSTATTPLATLRSTAAVRRCASSSARAARVQIRRHSAERGEHRWNSTIGSVLERRVARAAGDGQVPLRAACRLDSPAGAPRCRSTRAPPTRRPPSRTARARLGRAAAGRARARRRVRERRRTVERRAARVECAISEQRRAPSTCSSLRCRLLTAHAEAASRPPDRRYRPIGASSLYSGSLVSRNSPPRYRNSGVSSRSLSPGSHSAMPRRRRQRAQRFAHEHCARLRGVRRQLLVRPDRERGRRHDEEREQRERKPRAITASPRAPARAKQRPPRRRRRRSPARATRRSRDRAIRSARRAARERRVGRSSTSTCAAATPAPAAAAQSPCRTLPSRRQTTRPCTESAGTLELFIDTVRKKPAATTPKRLLDHHGLQHRHQEDLRPRVQAADGHPPGQALHLGALLHPLPVLRPDRGRRLGEDDDQLGERPRREAAGAAVRRDEGFLHQQRHSGLHRRVRRDVEE